MKIVFLILLISTIVVGTFIFGYSHDWDTIRMKTSLGFSPTNLSGFTEKNFLEAQSHINVGDSISLLSYFKENFIYYKSDQIIEISWHGYTDTKSGVIRSIDYHYVKNKITKIVVNRVEGSFRMSH